MIYTIVQIENDEKIDYLKALSMVMASPNRGEPIKMIGRESATPYSKDIEVIVYAGTLLRASKIDKNYFDVVYLTAYGEKHIVVHKDKLPNIFKSKL